MKSYKQAIFYGFLVWLVPFIVSFFFVDQAGNFTIPETFFKSIMVVVSGLVGVTLAVRYFKKVKKDHLNEGIKLGLIWLVINWGIDLIFVNMGFFPMSIVQYFTDIGLRYLSAPIYTIGLGWALKEQSS